MSDVTVDAAATALWTGHGSGHSNGLRGPVWTSSSVGYLFYTDNSPNLYYRKTTDGGATWGSAVTVASSGSVWPKCPAIWFDKWTPGDSGTKIHIAYTREVGGDKQVYRSLDTSSDSLSSEVTISTNAFADSNGDTCTIQICKARGGNLYVLMAGGDFSGGYVYRSVDAGVNWTSRNTGYWESDNDDAPYMRLMPGNETDNQDMYLVFGDQSADEVSVKQYDDSANTWPTELSITTGVSLGWLGYFVCQIGVSIRHSDNHLIIAICNGVDSATADMLVYDLTNIGTKTAKTNVFSNSDDWGLADVVIDQNTDDIYVSWAGKNDGSQTWTSSVTVYYSKSTDDGATWGTPVAYSTTARDYRWLAGGVSTPGAAAGLFAPAMWDEDTSDLFVNAGNAVTLSAGSGSTVTSDVTSTAAVSTTNTSDVTSTAAISRTETKDVTSTAALSRTEVSNVTSDAALQAPASANVTSDAAIQCQVASDVTSGASISTTATSNVTSDAAVAMTGTKDVTTDAAIQANPALDVTTDAAIQAQVTSDVSSTASISMTVASDVTSGAAVSRTEVSNVTSDAAIDVKVNSDVSTSASVSVGSTGTLDVTSTAALARTETSSVTSDAAISMVLASDVTSGASVSIDHNSDVTSTGALATTGTSSVSSTAVLDAPARADVASSASVEVEGAVPLGFKLKPGVGRLYR